MDGRVASIAVCALVACALFVTSCDDAGDRAAINGRLIHADGKPASDVGICAVPCKWSHEVYETDQAGIEYFWDSRQLARGVPDAMSGRDGQFTVVCSPGQDVALMFEIPGDQSRSDTGAGSPLMMPSGMAPYPPIRLHAGQTLNLGDLRVADHSILGHILVPTDGLGVNAEYEQETRRVLAHTED